jgi:hypothetical protein
MIRNTRVLVLLLTVGLSCSEKGANKTCDVADPVAELEWMHAYAEETDTNQSMGEFLYIAKGWYQFQDVFVFGNCCPNCSSIMLVKNCFGATIGQIGGDIQLEQ